MLGTKLSNSILAIGFIRSPRWLRFRSRKTRTISTSTPKLIQFVLRKLRIAELPIPTFYGDEVCHVTGGNMRGRFSSPRSSRLCGFTFLRSEVRRQSEIGSHSDKLASRRRKPLRLNPVSPAKRSATRIGHGMVSPRNWKRGAVASPRIDFAANELAEKLKRDSFGGSPSLPHDIPAYDQISHGFDRDLHDPKRYGCVAAGKQRSATGGIITSANVAFFVTRFMLALGQFNYSRKGILGLGHRRLFTFQSLSALLEQAGYEILEARGVPGPFPLALGPGFWGGRC